MAMFGTARSGRKHSLTLAATATAAALLAASAPAAVASGTSPAQPARKLNILMSNDDGQQGPFIRALQKSLKAAGHDAVIVAPATDQSGKGTGINATPGSIVKASEVEPGIWSVEGTPADSVAFGLANVFKDKQPDLVVTGINPGQNIGSTANHSGTVGASITAAEHGVPAVAFSAEYSQADPRNPFPQMPQALSFAVKLVDRLASSGKRNGPVLPAHTTLNVNYPAKPTGKVQMTNVGEGDPLAVVYVKDASCDSCYKLSLGLNPDFKETVSNADTTAISKGAVSISMLDGDWTVPGWQWGQRARLLDAVGVQLRLAGLTA
ncbi:5'/3'-nucleotidase SurE [Streptomyces sp. SID3343]|uniref:5'/3'-nucleotidase SurE n=1 Tax=Streptomyces sp. SID3343 TaxID=2690260 RepID=UPI00136927D2|nr:5'/3'-nucleotidase SurE [Streptomyces sp. SID3343]MYW06548.1 5'/3'-nucleotidase SurE [Streptomyces sp. SID3343]